MARRRPPETALYQPVKEYLQQHGYRVGAEVKDCDIAAIKGDELVVVELKSAANLKLLIQATDRQAITNAVYVALPEPSRRTRQFHGVERLLKKLGLGLITVRFSPIGACAAVCFDPPARYASRGKRRAAVIREMAGRSGDTNVGGSARTPLMTAYRETAIYIACCLEALGPCSTTQLRARGAGDRVAGILAKNYYGWFERVRRGTYRLTSAGREEIHRHPELRKRCLAVLDLQRHSSSLET